MVRTRGARAVDRSMHSSGVEAENQENLGLFALGSPQLDAMLARILDMVKLDGNDNASEVVRMFNEATKPFQAVLNSASSSLHATHSILAKTYGKFLLSFVNHSLSIINDSSHQDMQIELVKSALLAIDYLSLMKDKLKCKAYALDHLKYKFLAILYKEKYVIHPSYKFSSQAFSYFYCKISMNYAYVTAKI